MNIRFLGAHNCESQSTSCICLLIDNTLAIDAGGLTSNLSISEQEKLNAILLTHQHYDHIRDIPGIALNLFLQGANIKVFSTESVLTTIKTHLLNGTIYPQFQNIPVTKPTVSLNVVKPYVPENIDGHEILAIPVRHFENTVGYQVSDRQGKRYSIQVIQAQACQTAGITYPRNCSSLMLHFPTLTKSLPRKQGI